MSELSLPLDDTVLFDPAAPGAIEMASELIAQGGVVAIPTDTVYGVAASLSHPGALRRIYEIKGRDRSKPLPILVFVDRCSGSTRARDRPQRCATTQCVLAGTADDRGRIINRYAG